MKGINVLGNILIGLILLIVVANVSADQGIGFVAGPTYGYGLGYSRYLDNGYGWQISGFPYVEEDHRNLNLGLIGFKTLHEGKSGRVFISLGGGIHHQCDEWEDEIWEDESTPYPEPRQRIEETLSLVVGPGVGLEWKFFENFTFSIGIPMAIFLENHKDRDSFDSRQSECCFDVQMVRCHETEEEYINEKYKSDLFHYISDIVSIDILSMLRYI